MNVVIAAAGTGGHINPGLAIADKICAKIPGTKIAFIGTPRGLENELVPKAGYQLERIDAWGLKKEISITNLIHMIRTYKSKVAVEAFLKDFKPDLVIGTGGYICGPVIKVATDLLIPTILHESNVFPGKAVRMFASRVDEVMTGFEETIKRLPKSTKKAVYTGTPTNIKKLDLTYGEREELLKKIGYRLDIPNVLIFGGSQGAQMINEAVVGILANGLNKDYNIVWATGQKQFDIVKETLEEKGMDINKLTNATIVPYIYNMEEHMNVADLVVCRSGAMTCTELTTIGKPAIFVPLPSTGANRQLDNARVIEVAGGAMVIRNNELTWNNLSIMVNRIVHDKNKLELMSKGMLRMAPPDNVEDLIFREIVKLLDLDEDEIRDPRMADPRVKL